MNHRVTVSLLYCTALVLLQLQLALGQSPLEPVGTFDFMIGNVSRLVNGQDGNGGNYTTFLVSGNASYLAMINRYNPASVNNPGPYCYLEVFPRYQITPPAVIEQWTKPCPRTAQAEPSGGFWCQFEFSAEGNLILRSGGSIVENGTVLWSSNTTGLGARRLGMVDVHDGGNLMLYNSSGGVVWRNIRDNPPQEDYACRDAASSPVGAPGNRKLLHHV